MILDHKGLRDYSAIRVMIYWYSGLASDEVIESDNTSNIMLIRRLV